MEVDWGGKIDSNHISGWILSEADWGAQYSSLFLYLAQIDPDGEPQGFFTSGLWGGLPQGKFSTSWGDLKEHFPISRVYVDNLAIAAEGLWRSFKTLFPCSNMNDDEKDFGKCVTASHHVNANLDQLVAGKVVTVTLHQAIVFLEKRDGQDQESSQGGVIEFLPASL